ncbi:right-handed parallel beta-helix repeat-containing protein [Bacillus pumilus]|uniref:right-handed parallel beta-helix repeat-containing protein n=1 Tax=Bacillus pumilus TaxID=1408 RepID=UPI001B3A7873|nr:right-handed parallel beta-helix repeat-containing protein [Bacillus pumilus]MBQ4817683.1 right-handed parallel beta-helix repeat-containing protein [Bacillus pumilus]
MANVFLKRIASAWDRIARNNLNDNFSNIEQGFTKVTAELNAHKNASPAHKSEQIQHGLFTAANRLDNLNARFANLVVNHDGEDVKEVVDLRVALDASTHLTAKDRFDYDFAKLLKKIDDMAVFVSLRPYLEKYGNFDDAMQAALDLSKSKPITLVVPPGNYTQTRTLRIFRNTRLIVQAGAVIKRNFVGSMLVNGLETDNFSGYNGNGNIIIEGGGTFDSNGAVIKQQCSVFGFAHSDGIIIRDITVLDVVGGHAFDCAGNQNVLIENVKFKGFADYKGDRWFSAAIQLDLMRSAGNFGAFGAYDQTVTRNIIIRGNYFGRSSKLGGWARAVDSHTSTDGVWYSVIRILDNVIEDTTEYAISGNKWHDTRISGNKINNCASGIRIMLPRVTSAYTHDANGNPTGRVNKTKHHVISENTITNITKNHAIQVYGRKGYQTIDDVTIANNVIDNVVARHGIHVSDVYNYTIASNVVDRTGHHGILITRSMYGTVTANVLRGIKGNGVRVEEGGCNNVTVANNILKDVGFSGVSVSGDSKRVRVFFNTLVDVGARATESDGYDGIIFLTGVSRSMCAFNDVTGPAMRHGIYITNTCSRISSYGNYVKGAGFDVSYKNNSTEPINSTDNVI